MRKTIVLLGFCVLLFSGISCDKPIKEVGSAGYDLYLLVGQSNMAGRGFLEKEDTTIHSHVFVLNANDTFVIAKEPLHYDKKNRGTGPGLEFGKKMADFYSGSKIGLIPAAVGGTKVSYWQPNNKRGLFEEAIRKSKVAMQFGKLKGIIWQQGESDSNYKDAPVYKERLLNVLRNLRKELGNEELPIVVGGLGDFLKSPYYKVINKTLEEITDEINYTRYSEPSTLGHIGDSLHFNSKAQRENGRDMAYEMWTVQKTLLK